MSHPEHSVRDNSVSYKHVMKRVMNAQTKNDDSFM